MNEKTLVFDNGGAMDGNLVAALMNGNNRNNGYGNGYGWEWMWMILLWALWGETYGQRKIGRKGLHAGRYSRIPRKKRMVLFEENV